MLMSDNLHDSRHTRALQEQYVLVALVACAPIQVGTRLVQHM